jgi:hypothetical protein
MTTVALLSVVAFAAATGGVAFGNHVFPDVATNSPFHQEVANVAGAGIATGFPNGTYHPQDPVNRQQMAAFMNRGSGRVAFGESGGFVNATTNNVPVDIASVTVTAGATGAAATGGFVLVTGSVNAESLDFGDCPCSIFADVEADNPVVSSGGQHEQLGNVPGPGSVVKAGFGVTAVFEIGPDETRTFTLRGQHFDADDPTVKFDGDLSAIYVPFGPDGGNDL